METSRYLNVSITIAEYVSHLTLILFIWSVDIFFHLSKKGGEANLLVKSLVKFSAHNKFNHFYRYL